MPHITLEEHGQADHHLTDIQAAAIAQAAGSRLILQQTSRVGWRRLKATSYVGTVVAGDIEVRIRPKVPITNVLHLLSTAGQPPSWLTGQRAGYDTARDALAAFALLYGHTLSATLSRGALRGYREHHEPLVAIRGRIDLAAQLRRPDRHSPVRCRFTDHTADIDANRYVKHATGLLLRTPGVPSPARRLCKHALQRLDEVGDQPPPVDLPERIVHTRLTRHYAPLLTLAGLLRRCLQLSDEHGQTTASTFLLDMNALFERFVLRALGSALGGRLTVAGQQRTHLDRERQVQMIPDLLFSNPAGRVVLVGDTKYKLTDDGVGGAADHYQLLAYCIRHATTDGVLLYAAGDGPGPLRTVTVEHTGIRLHSIGVDLAGPPEGISASIASIAVVVNDLAAGRRSRA